MVPTFAPTVVGATNMPTPEPTVFGQTWKPTQAPVLVNDVDTNKNPPPPPPISMDPGTVVGLLIGIVGVLIIFYYVLCRKKPPQGETISKSEMTLNPLMPTDPALLTRAQGTGELNFWPWTQRHVHESMTSTGH